MKSKLSFTTVLIRISCDFMGLGDFQELFLSRFKRSKSFFNTRTQCPMSAALYIESKTT